MMASWIKISTTVLLVSLVSACTKDLSPTNYEASEVGVVSKVRAGVILAKRAVQITESSNNVGGLAGAVAGGAGGSLLGGKTATKTIGAVGGAVVGGLLGSAADKAMHRQTGFEYIIRLNDESSVSVTQSKEVQFNAGDRVLVIYGATTRIIPDQTSGGVKEPNA
jgi:outer membrane lipoprotein SlyB